MKKYLAYGAIACFLLAAGLYAGLATGVLAPYVGDDATSGEFDRTTVVIEDGDTGAELGTVDAVVADTLTKRYVGLSETEELPADRGMLFVHDDVDDRTYVMRNMSFGIDIIFIDAGGEITAIHEAPAPQPGEDGSEKRYSGSAQYVLEVNIGWSSDRGVAVGDRVRFELPE